MLCRTAVRPILGPTAATGQGASWPRPPRAGREGPARLATVTVSRRCGGGRSVLSEWLSLVRPDAFPGDDQEVVGKARRRRLRTRPGPGDREVALVTHPGLHPDSQGARLGGDEHEVFGEVDGGDLLAAPP